MIDFSRIKTYPISARQNKFKLSDMIPLDHRISYEDENLTQVAKAVFKASQKNSYNIFMLGGAVIKVGCSDLLIDLMEKGFINHLAVNGAVSIHDFEVAMIGESSEDVEKGLEDGLFGMVEETGRYMNEAIIQGMQENIGYGRSIGKKIEEMDFPYKKHSLFYNAYRLNIPITVHIAIGGDIIHQHPSCDGAALGQTSFTDFKLLTESVSKLAGGALLNIGSAVNLPEAFLKALTITRNLKIDVREFCAANFDFFNMYRPRTRLLEWPKSLDCQTYDVRANHNQTIPTLHRLVLGME